MNYQEVLSAIHSRKQFSSGGPTLDRIQRLMSALGNPQESYQTIHIAGTNGKGSTAAMTASVLRTTGKRVGLFTSPYLVDFRERIRIDGELISQEELTACYQLVMEKEQTLEESGFEPVNEFELVTALGFLAFCRAGVDYAVIEVGLGGRSDPTNILKAPAVCCITSISLDHTAVLGDSLEKIAAEKAGIIKNGVPVVTCVQPPEVMCVLSEAANACSSLLIIAEHGQVYNCTAGGFILPMGDAIINVPFMGSYQADNAACVYQLCRCIGISESAICDGIANTSWPGRLQYLSGPPNYLIDAGHNIAGIKTVCTALEQYFSGKRIFAIIAMMKDKDYQVCIPMVAEKAAAVIGTTVGLPRSLTPEEVAQVAEPYTATYTAPNVRDAIETAQTIAGPEDVILICGSVYAAGEAVRELNAY